MMLFRTAGDTEQGHSHPFDHLTLLAKGSLRVTVDGLVTDFQAPHMIYIQKDKTHELVALESETLAFCIHGLRDKSTGDILDVSMIPAGIKASTFAGSLTGKSNVAADSKM
jgi:quercetin dioxygenase-like cupin family protein